MRVAILNNDVKMFTLETMPKILELMAVNRDTTFLITDCQPLVARFFQLRGYRKCILYHVGDKPKSNIGKYQTKSGYSSCEEVYITMKDEADLCLC